MSIVYCLRMPSNALQARTLENLCSISCITIILEILVGEKNPEADLAVARTTIKTNMGEKAATRVGEDGEGVEAVDEQIREISHYDLTSLVPSICSSAAEKINKCEKLRDEKRILGDFPYNFVCILHF